MSGLEVVAKALIAVAAKPMANKLSRQEKVVAMLLKFKLTPKVPPRNFDDIYTYCLIQYCYGLPRPIVEFFRLDHIRQAFRRSFESGDPRYLDREAEEVIQWNDETGELGRLDYDLRREFAGFTAVFNTLVDRSRGAAEARAEKKIDSLQEQLERLSRQLSSQRSLDRIREIAATPAAGQHDPIGWLGSELKGWFDAIGFSFEDYQPPADRSFEWIIRVPARRRYDRVVVYGVAGEIGPSHIEHAIALVDQHDAHEAWVVCPRRISAAARATSAEKVTCYTLDELIDEDADFDSYFKWLDQEIKIRKIDQNYVPVYCSKDEYNLKSGKKLGTSVYDAPFGGLQGYVQSWLTDPSKEHLSVLGEFGMGKSWFCLHLAWTLANQYIEATRRGLPRPRLPLLIPLRDYAKAVTAKSLFSEFFFRKHQVLPAGYKAFEYLNQSGRLLLIFDGFDEMAARVSKQERINNFWELATVVSAGSKVLLTCRTEHFPEARESRDLLGAKLKASTQSLTGTPPQFEVVDLLPFDAEQIRQMLNHIAKTDAVEAIMSNDELLDLMARPVMSELVLDALPEITEGRPVDLSRVYFYAVRRKIDRDIQAERTFTSMSDKVFFLCELSWEMLSTDTMTINYREFPDRIRSCFGTAVQQDKDLDHWHHDMLGQSMLIRNSDGDYTPAHRSLIEFFVAYRFAAELAVLSDEFLSLVRDDIDPTTIATWSEYFSHEDSDPDARAIAKLTPEPLARLREGFGLQQIAPVVIGLMLPLFDKEAAIPRLLEIVKSTRELSSEDIGFIGGNAASLLVRLDHNILRDLDLQDISLRGAELFIDESVDVDLTNANLSGADLSESGLLNVQLNGADLTGATLKGSQHLGMGREYPSAVQLRQDELLIATSTGSILRWSDFHSTEIESQAVTRFEGVPSIIEFLVSSKFAVVLARNTTIVDLDTFQVQHSINHTLGYIPVYGVDYLGVVGCSIMGPTTEWTLTNIVGERTLDATDLKETWKTDFYNPDLGVQFVVNEDGRILSMETASDVICPAPVGQIENKLAGRDVSLSSMRVLYSGRHIWVIDSDADAWNIAMCTMDGQLVTTIKPRFPNEPNKVWKFRIGDVVFDEQSRVLAIATGSHGVIGVDVDTSDVLWTEPNAIEITAVANQFTSPLFVAVSRYGDVTFRSVANGELLSHVSIDKSKVDLRLSGDCDVSQSLFESLIRNGASIETDSQ